MCVCVVSKKNYLQPPPPKKKNDLDKAACNAWKDRATLKIYDPYYCMGTVVKHLNSLGFVVLFRVEFYGELTGWVWNWWVGGRVGIASKALKMFDFGTW